MKFLIIGLGSMGKRRIRNLQALNQKEIIGFDISEEKRREAEEKYGIPTFDSMESALKGNPSAIIISTPPNLHYEYAILAIEKEIPFFMELNIISDGLKEVVELGKGKNLLMAASCNMKYVESIKKLKELLSEIGKITAFTYHVGQYLPDWHPNEDYRKFFGANEETNACKEIIPGELKWMEHLFGKVSSVSASKGKFSDLEIAAPDTYQIILKFDKLIGHYLAEVVSRFPYRNLKIIGTEGTLIWDHSQSKVSIFTKKDNSWRDYLESKGDIEGGYIHKEQPYIAEMSDFIKALKKEGEYPFNLEKDIKILEILDAIEESTKTKKEIGLGGKNE